MIIHSDASKEQFREETEELLQQISPDLKPSLSIQRAVVTKNGTQNLLIRHYLDGHTVINVIFFSLFLPCI